MTDSTPYTAVIFSAQRTTADPDGYDRAARQMERLAAAQPGYRGIESVRRDDGFGITVSYWDSPESAHRWKQHHDHIAVQATGRQRWYENYRVRIATIEREYSYDRTDMHTDGVTP